MSDTKRSGGSAGRPRGRPRAFDTGPALDRAIALFWERGYEGVSVADLTAAMGIAAPSLYAAFGSKEYLYRLALERYRAVWGGRAARALDEEPTAFGAVSRLLREAARDFTAPDHPAGCMIATAVLGCAPENQGAAEAAAGFRGIALAALRRKLETAVEVGELARGTDVEALARFYGAVVQGLSVQARDGAGESALRGVVEVALAAWPGKSPRPAAGMK